LRWLAVCPGWLPLAVSSHEGLRDVGVGVEHANDLIVVVVNLLNALLMLGQLRGKLLLPIGPLLLRLLKLMA
jgi:hypothetical protein